MKKVLLFLLLSHILLGQCKGQDACLSDTTFKTDSLGNESEKLDFPLYFSVTSDSINIYYWNEQTISFLSFKILTKSCNWKKYRSEGIISYRLLLLTNDRIEKHPILNMVFVSPSHQFVEILYENSEKRIFTLAKKSQQP